MKVLLGQLNANGDCLYATILARQIKKDFPGCELTWAISSQCSHILKEVPYVDKTWEFSVSNHVDRENAWWALEKAVLRNQSGSKGFDKVVLSQISPGNFRNYDGTIRTSLLRAYEAPITVPIDNIIVLDDVEKNKVDDFVKINQIEKYDYRILVECSSSSGQSYVTPEFALEVAEKVNKELGNSCFIISTHENICIDIPHCFSASDLNMRENSALTHYCTMFVGCGSGLTAVATSTASKEIPNLQLLIGRTSVYASFFHDFRFYGKKTDRFIELADAPAEKVISVIKDCCLDGLEKARDNHHQPIPVTYDFYCELINQCLLEKHNYLDALQSLAITVQRYGWCEQLAIFGKKKILPFLLEDSLVTDPHEVEKREELLSYFERYDPAFKLA